MTRTKLQAVLLLGGLLCAAAGLRAEPVWVSDEFEVMLRTGPSTSNAITRVLPSGTRLEMLERDATEEYSRVSTAGGTEGWILTRYLMEEPSAREQLQRLTAQLTSARSEGNSLGSQLAAITRQHDAATARISSLEREKQALESQLEEIKRTAANVLAIDQLNKELREQLTDAEIKVSTLEQENRELMGQTKRNWFLAGGLVLLVGVVLGLWLPRIRWQKRGRYERF